MIVEVNDLGEILIPADLVRAAPRTQLEAAREGERLVLKPIVPKATGRTHSLVDALPSVAGRFVDPAMTFRREDIYGPDASR